MDRQGESCEEIRTDNLDPELRIEACTLHRSVRCTQSVCAQRVHMDRRQIAKLGDDRKHRVQSFNDACVAMRWTPRRT